MERERENEREMGLRRSAVWVWGGWRHESEANPWLEAADGLVMSRFGGGDVEDESGRRRWIRELKRVTLREFAWESFERWWELQHWERERERTIFIILIGPGVKNCFLVCLAFSYSAHLYTKRGVSYNCWKSGDWALIYQNGCGR